MINLVCGAPASGKSSLTKELTKNGAISLNRDTENGTILSLLPKMENLLKENKDIVLDNLFPTAEIRKPFIDLAKQYNTEISCFWMSTSIEDAQYNFVLRAFNLINKFPMPEAIKAAKHSNIFPPVVFFKYRKEFQKPDLNEGFSKIDKIEFIRKYNPDFTNKALFLDFDGTLRECINGNNKYPISKDQIEIKPNCSKILKSYRDQGYILLGISNQSGVHKGDLTEQTAHELFQHTNKLLDVDIDYRFCSHQSAPISCYCRKPQNGIFVEFLLKYKLDPKQCKFVGDYKTDETFSKRSGIEYIDQAEFFK